MHAEIVIAGSGGQGVLVIGRLLAEAGFLEDREVVWLPSYGAEKRGGTVSCSVTISSDHIGALTITRPTAAIAMHQTPATKLESALKSQSLLTLNESMIPGKVSRQDIQTVYVPASQLAIELGNESVANLVALGALIANYPVVSRSSIISAMEAMFAKNQKALELNKQAFEKGFTGHSATPRMG